MTLQDQLQAAITQVRTDSKLLHDIVHGDPSTTVSTESGPVDSLAKILQQIEQAIATQLSDWGLTAGQLSDALEQAQEQARIATEQAHHAQQMAHSVALPTDLTGLASQLLRVKASEDGYETTPSSAVFYGLKKVGAKLLVLTGAGTVDIKALSGWIITLPGVQFQLSDQGHLLLCL